MSAWLGYLSSSAGDWGRLPATRSGSPQHGSSGWRSRGARFAVNVVGAFLIGIIVVLADEDARLSLPLRSFLVVGILGGFTTFSSFSIETLRLWERESLWAAAAP